MGQISTRELERMFDDLLDEDGPVVLGGYNYAPSDVFKRVDPTAYRCGLVDFADSLLSDGHIVEGYSDNTEDGDECELCSPFGTRCKCDDLDDV